MRCPCKDCDKRKLGCHGMCKEYQEWKKWNEEKNEKRREERKKGDCHSKALEKSYYNSLRRR